MCDKNRSLQSVRLYQEVELQLRCLQKARVISARHEPRRATWNGPAIVSRKPQMLLAEFIERLAPAAVAAVQRHCVNALVMPPKSAREIGQRHIRSQVHGSPNDFWRGQIVRRSHDRQCLRETKSPPMILTADFEGEARSIIV